jgi:hypothetical protein
MDTYSTSDVLRQDLNGNEMIDIASASEQVDVELHSPNKLSGRILVVVVLVLYIIASFGLLITVNTTNIGAINNKDGLVAPDNIYINQAILHWDIVPSVDEYCVNIVGDNTRIIVKDNYAILHGLVNNARYIVNLQSIKDGQLSTHSDNIEYVFVDPTVPSATRLDTPQLQLGDNQHSLVWSQVSDAIAYSVYCDSVEIAQTKGTSVDIIQFVNGSYIFEVMALSGDVNRIHSNLSNSVDTGVSHNKPSYDLSVPKVSIVDSKVIWQAVDNATSYDVLMSSGDTTVIDYGPKGNDQLMYNGINRQSVTQPYGNSIVKYDDTYASLDWIDISIRARNAVNASDWSTPVRYLIPDQ